MRFDKTAVVFLAAGVILTLVSNGRWILPFATWVAPVGWLVFMDRSRLSHGSGAGLVIYIGITTVMWQGLIPAPGIIYYMITLVYGLVYFIPYIIHRAVAPRLRGILSTLVFPTGWVAVEFVFHRWLTPYGSWFSLAYTQTDYSALLQVASISGIAGISFLMTWFASIIAWMWGASTDPSRNWRPVSAFGLALLVVLIYGQMRLSVPLPNGNAIRTASVVPTPALMDRLEETLAPARHGESFSDQEFASLREAAVMLNSDLFDRTRREALAGADLITWAETAGRVLKEDEPVLIEDLRQIAHEFGIVLVIGYGVFDPEASPPLENKVGAIDASGNFLWEYQKAHPIVGAESGFIRSGDGIIRVLESEFGKIGAVICHDLDFPELLLDASRLNLDLVVGPSADWFEITPLHANMAILRAIEGGFSLLRPTSSGRSVATDHTGRRIAEIDFMEDVLVASMAPAHVVTIYQRVGDLFAWLCIIAAGMLIYWSRRNPQNQK